jgi:hypothetical protein
MSTIKFELIVEISEADIREYNDDMPMAIKEITNTLYLGLSCIDGMLNRQFEIDGAESYVHSITDEAQNEY